LLEDDLKILHHEGFLGECIRQFREVGCKLWLRRLEEVLADSSVAIVESSHGILTDAEVGLKPHVSAIRTLPCFTTEMLREAGYEGRIATLGVQRAYSIRHGAGPLPTHDPEMSELLLPGSSKAENRWQGKVRVGPLDIPLLKHAIDLCGGPSEIDGLAITWFDQIVENGVWRLCYEYEDPTCRFDTAVPIISEIPIDSGLSRDAYFDIVAEVLNKVLQVPVRMVSFGACELDKVCR